MSFGVSPDQLHTKMVGADVAVAWVDRETGKGYAHDYFLDAKSQCSGNRGSCPDTRLSSTANSIRLLNAAMVNGYSIVTYQRPLKANDQYDVAITVNGTQAIVWAVGPLNQRNEVSYHSKYTKGDRFIDFGRQPFWNCPMPDADKTSVEDDIEPEYYQPINGNRFSVDDNRRQTAGYLPTSKPKPAKVPATPQPAAKEGAWEIPPIQCYEPEDGVFYAQMGPTGGKFGYPAITGHVGWGISWYINGLLIPEINVVRGRTYTFVVEGGYDPEVPAKYHPFYISDDPVGGYEHKTDEEKAKVKLFAGTKRSRNGEVIQTGTGRLCNWTPDIDGPSADEYSSFGAYQRSLTLKCDEGEPGIITWTPDQNTPDTVFYQCFTHRYLGWRINVLDECDDDGEASELDEVYADPEDDESIQAESSIRHESKLRPQDQFLLAHEKDTRLGSISDESENTSEPHIQSNDEISKLISDGIKAAEELEQQIANEPKLNITRQTPLQFNQGEIDESEAMNVQRLPAQKQDLPPPSNRPGELPLFLRPPQNYMNTPSNRPVKLAIRRPVPYERRPIPYPHRQPIAIPQSSMLISHYKKPVAPFMRPFVKPQQVPIKSIASVLLLGEPTEISPPVTPKTNPYHHQQQPQTSQKSSQIVPLPDFQIAGKKKTDIPFLFPLKEKKASKPQYYEKPVLQKSSSITYDMKRGTVDTVDMKPAINVGFRPTSVIVESGFRPIVNRNDEVDENGDSLNRRRDENISDIDDAISGDALLINQEERREDANKQFEPMFIPSPLDSVSAGMVAEKERKEFESKYPNHKPEHLSGDLRDMEVEDGEDKMAVAAEQQNTYYLPPDNRRNRVYPEGTVVTYDGKAVLDTSLVNSAPQGVAGHNIFADVSRTEQLIRDTPQFVPFRGEIPPLLPELFPKDNIQFTLSRSGPQSPVTEYLNPLSNPRNRGLGSFSAGQSSTPSPISTKLTLLGANERNFRTKRSPHHHPDHHGDEHDYDQSKSSSALNFISKYFFCLSLLTTIYFSLSF